MVEPGDAGDAVAEPQAAGTGHPEPVEQQQQLGEQQAMRPEHQPAANVSPDDVHQRLAQAVQHFEPHQHESAVDQTHAPAGQTHYGHHQQLLYAHHDATHHPLAHQLHHQEHHPPPPEAHGQEHPEAGAEAEMPQPQAQVPPHLLQHPEAHLHQNTAGLVMPHPASFAQQLMDPHMSQQQIAQYHQQITQFQPGNYSQQLGPGQYLQDVTPLYFAQGLAHPQLQTYQDASGNVQEHGKLPDMSIDEAAAAHLTALRNTGRGDGQLGEGHQSQVALGQPPLGHMGLPPGMQDAGNPNARDVYMQGNPQALALAATAGRAPSKRKAWRASHEGQGADGVVAEPPPDGGRARRKQTRRPDRLCHHEGCFVTPTYNFPNEKKRIFCVTHKLDGMVNVVAKRCAHPDCNVNPRFNYDGNTRGMYCSEHKLEGMVNVIDRRCQEADCKKFPSHNYPGSHKKLYCATHKKDGMVDMSHGSS